MSSITLHNFSRTKQSEPMQKRNELNTFITQIGIVPSTEEILLIPFGFTVTNHNNLILSSHSDDSFYFCGLKSIENYGAKFTKHHSCVYGRTVTDRINGIRLTFISARVISVAVREQKNNNTTFEV